VVCSVPAGVVAGLPGAAAGGLAGCASAPAAATRAAMQAIVRIRDISRRSQRQHVRDQVLLLVVGELQTPHQVEELDATS
jgi:hypothetical protein